MAKLSMWMLSTLRSVHSAETAPVSPLRHLFRAELCTPEKRAFAALERRGLAYEDQLGHLILTGTGRAALAKNVEG